MVCKKAHAKFCKDVKSKAMAAAKIEEVSLSGLNVRMEKMTVEKSE